MKRSAKCRALISIFVLITLKFTDTKNILDKLF